MFGHRKGWRGGRGKGPGRKKFKECICPRCKTIIPNIQGIPCFRIICPKCNTPMMARLLDDNYS